MAETELPMLVDRAWLDMPDVGHEIIDDVERAANFAHRSDAAEMTPVIRSAAKLIKATARTDRGADARASRALKELERCVRAVGGTQRGRGKSDG